MAQTTTAAAGLGANTAAGNANSEEPEVAWISKDGPYLVVGNMGPDGNDVYSYFSLKRFDIDVVVSSDGRTTIKSILFNDKDFQIYITDDIKHFKSLPSRSGMTTSYRPGPTMASFHDRLIWYLGHSTPYTEQLKKPSAATATTATVPANWATFGGGARKTRRRKSKK